MKVRNYEVENLSKALLFCPNCHRRISLPFKGNNINVQSAMKLKCGNCTNGLAIVRVKQVEVLKKTDPIEYEQT